MNTPEGLLMAGREQGLVFFVQEGRLFWFAPTHPGEEVLDWARNFKANLKIRLEDRTLEAQCAIADPEEAAYLREERAAAMEFDGGLSRLESEWRAGVRIVPSQT